MSTIKIDELQTLGRNPAAGDLVPIWDGVLSKTRQVDVALLPGSGGGGGVGDVTLVPSPFLVFAGSANYSYDAGTNSVTIRDARLLNKTNYPIFATQIPNELDPAQLTFNPVDPDDDTLGNVVIANFQLNAGDHLTITVPGSLDPSGDATYAALLADVALLKAIAAPFYTTALGPNGAKVWWIGAVIPAGWQECIAMRGYIPWAQDSTSGDPDVSAAIGTEGGAKTLNLTTAQLPAHAHFTTVDDTLDIPDHPSSVGRVISAVRSFIKYYLKSTGGGAGGAGAETYELCGAAADGAAPTLAPTSTVGAAADINMMNPYKIGMWIEFAGV